MAAHDGKQPAPLTDSPFFWVALFGAMALFGLAVVGPKYERRQERLQRQRQAREQVWRKRIQAGVESPQLEPPTASHGPATGSPNLWPLFLIITAIVVPVAVWLIVRHIQPSGDPTDPPQPLDR